MKTTTLEKENAMEDAARKALAKMGRIKVNQCMYVSMDTLNTSPVRVYVECNQKELKRVMPEPLKPVKLDSMNWQEYKSTVEWSSYIARRANWKESMQSESGRLMADAALLLVTAGINYKAVKCYGWHQLTILP